MGTKLNIAIDGPAGAGKSTVAKMLARELGLLYIDTGAMYRAVTLKALREGVNLEDYEALGELAYATPVNLEVKPDGSLAVLLEGQDVTEEIRSPEVTGGVSLVASVPAVRSRLVELQRAMAVKGGVVMEGRDIGTVVLPDAPVKIFLTASTRERARRRREELALKGIIIEQGQMEEEIKRRDHIDSSRKADPLRRAPDAVIFDSTPYTVKQVVKLIISRLPAGVKK